MEPRSEYQVQINGASSDEIEVSEKAAIESSTFEIERDNTASRPVVPGKTYTILTTGGGAPVEPTVAIADFPFINFTLSEDGYNGYLTTSRSAERFAELASTPNEAAVANALELGDVDPRRGDRWSALRQRKRAPPSRASAMLRSTPAPPACSPSNRIFSATPCLSDCGRIFRERRPAPATAY